MRSHLLGVDVVADAIGDEPDPVPAALTVPRLRERIAAGVD